MGGIQNSEFGIQNGGTTGRDHKWAQMGTNFWGVGVGSWLRDLARETADERG